MPKALSQMSRRIADMPQQLHYSGYVLIYPFCGGVLKDWEAPFSLNYICLKNYLNLRFYTCMLLLIVCYLQVLWN